MKLKNNNFRKNKHNFYYGCNINRCIGICCLSTPHIYYWSRYLSIPSPQEFIDSEKASQKTREFRNLRYKQSICVKKCRIFYFKRSTPLPQAYVFIPHPQDYWNLIANCSTLVSKEKVSLIFTTHPPPTTAKISATTGEGGERTFSKVHPFFRLRVSRKTTTESSLRRKRKWVTHNNGGFFIPRCCDRCAFEHLPLPPFVPHLRCFSQNIKGGST